MDMVVIEDNLKKTQTSEVPENRVQEGAKYEEREVVRPMMERTLLSWKAPSRVYKERNREFWTTIFTMGGILGLILFFVEGWMPVAVLISLVFLLYVMSTVPPEEVEHRITNKGVVYGARTYLWEELVRFWFEEKLGQKILVVGARILPGRLELLLGRLSETEIKEVLKEYLLEERPQQVWSERAVKWIGKKMPLA